MDHFDQMRHQGFSSWIPNDDAAQRIDQHCRDEIIRVSHPASMHNQLGLAVMRQTYKAYRDLLESPRWQALEAHGAWPQRLLWASTGTKDPNASDTIYIAPLAADHTVNTMPEATLLAFADHGAVAGVMARDGADAEQVLGSFRNAGIDLEALAQQLQSDGAEAFVKSWHGLLAVLESKSAALAQ